MKSESTDIRAFVALEIEPGLRERIAEAIDALRPQVVGLRWVRPEGIHLTLRFLGPSSADSLRRLELTLRAAAVACPFAEAKAAGLGLFPERGRPRVLWLGIALPPAVFELQKACEAGVREAGFAPERRPFRSHLTLGRWRDPAPRPTLPEVDLGRTTLRTLVLFRSILRPSGAVYTPLATFPLGLP